MEHVIPLGYRKGRDISVLATTYGLTKLPVPDKLGMEGGSGYYEATYSRTPDNLIALRLCGISAQDIAAAVEKP